MSGMEFLQGANLTATALNKLSNLFETKNTQELQTYTEGAVPQTKDVVASDSQVYVYTYLKNNLGELFKLGEKEFIRRDTRSIGKFIQKEFTVICNFFQQLYWNEENYSAILVISGVSLDDNIYEKNINKDTTIVLSIEDSRFERIDMSISVLDENRKSRYMKNLSLERFNLIYKYSSKEENNYFYVAHGGSRVRDFSNLIRIANYKETQSEADMESGCIVCKSDNGKLIPLDKKLVGKPVSFILENCKKNEFVKTVGFSENKLFNGNIKSLKFNLLSVILRKNILENYMNRIYTSRDDFIISMKYMLEEINGVNKLFKLSAMEFCARIFKQEVKFYIDVTNKYAYKFKCKITSRDLTKKFKLSAKKYGQLNIYTIDKKSKISIKFDELKGLSVDASSVFIVGALQAELGL